MPNLNPDEPPFNERAPFEDFLEAAEPEPLGSAEGESPSTLGMYLKEISRIPLLAPEEERKLTLLAQAGDAEAERRMVEANLRLVYNLAKRYVSRGLPISDLIEEGNLGLLRAVRKFRLEKGTRLSTYATWWIRHAIARALANHARTIRLPMHVGVLLARYHREREALAQQLGRPPSVEEIAQAMSISAAQLAELEEVHQRPRSLEAPVGEAQRGALRDFLEDRPASSYSLLSTPLKERAALASVFDDLNENERIVLRLRFGLNGEEPMRLEVIARRLGLTRERVRQIESAGIKKIRRLLAERGIDAADFFG
ncbi:MAG: RNA polymerase sigma factor RpoD/SigA [Candidatus Methylomirabilia bacterium]